VPKLSKESAAALADAPAATGNPPLAPSTTTSQAQMGPAVEFLALPWRNLLERAVSCGEVTQVYAAENCANSPKRLRVLG
jgi:hypothetical protein